MELNKTIPLQKYSQPPYIAPLFVRRKWSMVALYRGLLCSVDDETVEVRKRRLARERKKKGGCIGKVRSFDAK